MNTNTQDFVKRALSLYLTGAQDYEQTYTMLTDVLCLEQKRARFLVDEIKRVLFHVDPPLNTQDTIPFPLERFRALGH